MGDSTEWWNRKQYSKYLQIRLCFVDVSEDYGVQAHEFRNHYDEMIICCLNRLANQY